MAPRHAFIVVLATTAVLSAPAATAVVPPKNCGIMKLSGKRMQVKVDQITCRSGKRYARTYLSRRSKPRGYRCRNYPARKNRVRFYCFNGRKVFFAITK